MLLMALAPPSLSLRVAPHIPQRLTRQPTDLDQKPLEKVLTIYIPHLMQPCTPLLLVSFSNRKDLSVLFPSSHNHFSPPTTCGDFGICKLISYVRFLRHEHDFRSCRPPSFSPVCLLEAVGQHSLLIKPVNCQSLLSTQVRV